MRETLCPGGTNETRLPVDPDGVELPGPRSFQEAGHGGTGHGSRLGRPASRLVEQVGKGRVGKGCERYFDPVLRQVGRPLFDPVPLSRSRVERIGHEGEQLHGRASNTAR